MGGGGAGPVSANSGDPSYVAKGILRLWMWVIGEKRGLQAQHSQPFELAFSAGLHL